MKKIAINHIGPPEWFNYKEEIIYGLYHGLRSNGYNARILNNQFDIASTNIIIGSDWIIQNAKFDEFINDKFDYFVFEVEKFEFQSLNNNPHFNIERYKKLLQNAKGIITPYIFNCETIEKSNFISKNNIQYLKWGFYKELIDPNIVRDQEKHLAGAFFGLLKGERLAKAEKIEKNLPGQVMFLGPEHPHSYRAAVLSSSNYSISLSYGETEKFINPFRLFYLYANQIPVLTDSSNDHDGYLQHAVKADLSEIIITLSKAPGNIQDILIIKNQSGLAENIAKIKLN